MTAPSAVYAAVGHTQTCNAAEGWVMAADYGRISSTGSGDTDSQDISGQVTADSGGVGGHLTYS